MFALENGSSSLNIPGLEVNLIENHTGTAKFDLVLVVKEDVKGLNAEFEYSTDLFNEATIRRMAGHLEGLLTRIVQNPDQPVMMLSFLSKEEIQQMLFQWNATDTQYSREYSVPRLIERQAAVAPKAIAVVCDHEQLTYCELNRRAEQLARYLNYLGVGPDTPVGICLERSLDMIVGLLGVLKAGGAYVPMDSSHPRERQAFLLEDAQISVVLTQRQFLSRLPEQGYRFICLDMNWEQIRQEYPENIPGKAAMDTIAYIIYTSGSTGKPKGVAVTHKNLLNLVFWHLRAYEITANDRTTQLAGVSFDASVWEIWPTLVAGASLYLANEEVRLSPKSYKTGCW